MNEKVIFSFDLCSLQDTCVALQALSEFAGAFFAPSGDLSSLTLSVKIKDFSHDFSINNNNRLMLQRLELKPDLIPNTIEVKGTGEGCALFQVKLYTLLGQNATN